MTSHEVHAILAFSAQVASKTNKGFLKLYHRFICRKMDSVMSFEDGRVFLKCMHCGVETPGWQVKP